MCVRERENVIREKGRMSEKKEERMSERENERAKEKGGRERKELERERESSNDYL